MVEHHELARTESIAARVAALWCSLAGSRRMPRDVSLLDQGADSLLLLALLAEIEGEFDVYVEADELIADPTISGLARAIAGRHPGGAA